MKSGRYSLILPIMVFAVVVTGFLLGTIFPDLTDSFYVYLAVAAGLAILAINRLAKRTVKETITDERIQGVAERAALKSFRIAAGTIGIFAFGVIALFPSVQAVRLVCVGAAIAIGLQGLIYSIAFTAIKSKG